MVGAGRGFGDILREFGPRAGARGITVNQINPGPIDTELNPADSSFAATAAGFTALGRYGTAAEIAATVAHLANDDGAYLTGAMIAVDGGFTS